MDQKAVLRLMLGVALVGTVFSGSLSYIEMSGGTCGLIFGLPSCVYGFLFFLLLLILCSMALKEKKRKR